MILSNKNLLQAIVKKARELGLVPLVNANQHAKRILRSCCALALLPANLIHRGFRRIAAEAAQQNLLQDLMPFLQYMVNTWMSDQMLPKLSVFGLRNRTNNVAETSNKMLRRRTGAHRPGLWHFLCKFQHALLDNFLIGSNSRSLT